MLNSTRMNCPDLTFGTELFYLGVMYEHFKELDSDEDHEVYELE